MFWSFLLEPNSLPQIARLFLICCLRCSSCQLGCPIILFSSCFSSSPDATACRSAICSPLHATLNSSSLPLLHLLCLATPSLYSLILALPVKVFSIIFLIRSPHAFLCSSMRCQRCTARRTSSVTMSLKVSKQHGKSSWLSLQNFSAGKLVRKMRSYFEKEVYICLSCISEISFRDCTRFDVHNQFRQLSVSFHVAHPAPARFDRCPIMLL